MEKKMTKTPWKINHWEPADDSGVTCKGQIDGIWYYTADGVTERTYGIRADVDPIEHNIQASFEGAHIADIPDFIHQDGGTESKANAIAIVTAINSTYGKGIDPSSVPDLLEALEAIIWTSENTCAETFRAAAFAKAKAAIEKSIIKQ